MADVALVTKNTERMLKAVYKNVRMAGDSIINLMPKVTDDNLKSDLTTQLSVYEAFASRAAKLLGEKGLKPEEEATLTKLSAKWGMAMNTMRDSSTEHLCEMLVEGATMGVNDMLRQIRESENGGSSPDALTLARDVCRYEEQTIEQFKSSYLK